MTFFTFLPLSHSAGESGIAFFRRGARRRRRSICGKPRRLWRGGGRVPLLFNPVIAVCFMLCCTFQVSVLIFFTVESDLDSIMLADTPFRLRLNTLQRLLSLVASSSWHIADDPIRVCRYSQKFFGARNRRGTTQKSIFISTVVKFYFRE